MVTENPYWLINDIIFSVMDNDGENDRITEILKDNGMICPERAKIDIYYSRFPDADWVDCPFCGKSDLNHTYEQPPVGLWTCVGCKKKFNETTKTFADGLNVEYHQWWRFAYVTTRFNTEGSCFVASDMQMDHELIVEMFIRKRRALKQDGKFGKRDINLHEILDAIFSIEKIKPGISKPIVIKKPKKSYSVPSIQKIEPEIPRVNEIEKKLNGIFNNKDNAEIKSDEGEKTEQSKDIFDISIPKSMLIEQTEKPTPPPPKKEDDTMNLHEYFAKIKG